MKVLFIGGTGIISSACTDLALGKGIELYLLNRGQSVRPTPAGAKVIRADINNYEEASKALEGQYFDAVVDWIAFHPDQIERDLRLFRGKCGQFVFISSASAYRTPPAALPVTESCVLANPHWEYSRNKIACEERLVRAYREEGFPITIVRPSHTYDKTLLPMDGGWTVVDRMRKGLEVIVHGDGTSLWTLTHHRDFAVGLVGLLGHPLAIGESFHITGDEWLSWNYIYQTIAAAAGVRNPRLVHVPSEKIAATDPDWGAGLLGDKAHSMVFDNTKIRRHVPEFNCVIPFHQGAAEILRWYDADPARQRVDENWNRRFEAVLAVR